MTTKLGKLVPSLYTNGQSDIDARRSELDSLLHHLTIPEIRRLKVQLGTIKIPNDICEELPTEILLIVQDYLDIEDVLRARSVSRLWNKAFSTAECCIGIIKTHFRPVWEARYRSLGAEVQLAEKEVLLEWLFGACRDRISRQRGRHNSMSCYRPESRVKDWQYNSGRLAFHEGGGVVYIRDLRRGVTTTYADPDRSPIVSWLLSDAYLVAVQQGPIRLRAWSLTKNPQESESTSPDYLVITNASGGVNIAPTAEEICHERCIRLPSPVLRITASQNRVGIITSTFEVFIWQIAGALQAVDTSAINHHLTHSRLTGAVVAFHQLEQSCFFVIYETTPKDLDTNEIYTRQTKIACEFNASKLVNTQILDLEMSQVRGFPATRGLHDGIVPISKHVLGSQSSVRVKARKREISCWYESSFPGTATTVMVAFDTYRSTFSIEDYCLPDSLNGAIGWDRQLLPFYWREQVIVPVEVGDISTELPHPELLLLAKEPFGAACKWMQGESTAEAAIGSIQSAVAANNTYGVLQGDDDFVVLRGQQGWVVWCFERGITLGEIDL